MFTLKFMQFFEEGGHIEDCVRCPHYEARKTSDGCWGITVYNDFTCTEGVERWVRKVHSPDQPVSFDVCWVENEDGKTLARYNYDS